MAWYLLYWATGISLGLYYRKVDDIAMKIYKVAVIGLLCGIFAALLAIRDQLVVTNEELALLNVEYNEIDGFEEMKKELK